MAQQNGRPNGKIWTNILLACLEQPLAAQEVLLRVQVA
jgi:hypothetical protein